MELAEPPWRIAQRVFERIHHEWMYRVTVNDSGIIIARTPYDPNEPLLWHHGVLVQMYDQKVGGFVPAIRALFSVLPRGVAQDVLYRLFNPTEELP